MNYIPGLHIKPMMRLSSQSSVPVIENQDGVIAGSSSILDALDARYPSPSLMPDDAELQASCRHWEQNADNEIGPPVRLLAYHVLLEYPDTVIPFLCQDGPWYGKAFLKLTHKNLFRRMRHFMKINESTAGPALEQLTKAVERVMHAVPESGYLVGDQFTRADMSVASLLAPLATPDGYGLDWPESVPEPMNALIGRFENAVEWTQMIYTRHR